jgi:hypothetical protein
MSYRINSTGRKRLLRENVHIRLVEQARGLPPSFTAEVKLDSGLKLDPDARVYIEPYVKSSSMRFDFGTVAAIAHPESCVLSDIDAGASVLFRVKVVSSGTPAGKVLASADGIRPADDSGTSRKSLLPLKKADIGQEVWRLEIDKDAGPVLTLNSRLPQVAERLRADPLLQGAIYPEVVRQLARRLLADGGESDEEETEWISDWKSWMQDLLQREVEAAEELDDDSLTELADEVVEAFARSNGFVAKAAAAIADVAGQI